MADFRMPSLGADMEAGTLVEWKVRRGDHVERGQIIAAVETDKGLIEVEVWESGTVEEIVVQPGTKVPVGTVLARIGGGGPAAPPPHRKRISPAARKHAAAAGLDPEAIEGTGPSGAVTVDDVERAAAARSARAPEAPKAAAVTAPAAPTTPKAAAVTAPAAPTTPQAAAVTAPAAPSTPQADRLAAFRRATAQSMARSKHEIPHYYLATEIDLTFALDWLEVQNRRRSIRDRLLAVVLLLKAVARAVREAPELNGFYVDDAFHPSDAVHLGTAIALRGGGLVAPAIHDADRLSLSELGIALGDLIGRVRAGTIRGSELSDPTITVTNLGDLGVTAVHGIIHPPQVALVGFGRVGPRPFCVEGGVVARPGVVATLAADHRVSDGLRGARFLAAVDRLLQRPELL